MSTMNPTVKRILPWVPLVVALIIGLVLGLLIGWVWWPVSWTNAAIVDLSPSQQAVYVGAVAEAYHFDGTQAATRRMEARLAPFGANTDEALTNAIEYYRGLSTPDEVMVANLALLATDLGIAVDAAMMAAEPGASAAEPDAAAALAAAAVAPAEKSGSAGIFTWILAVILSAGLIGAGFYLLMRLRAPRDLTDSMRDPAAPGSLQPVAGGTAPATRTTSWGKGDSGSAADAVDDDDLSFEDEEEPAVRFSDASGDMGAPDADDDDAPETPRYASARAEAENFGAYSGSSYDDSADDADNESDGNAVPADLPAARNEPAAAAAPAVRVGGGPGGGPVPADAPPVDINALTPPSWAAGDKKGSTTSKGAPNAKRSEGPTATVARTVAEASTIVTTGVAVAGERSISAPVVAPAAKPIASFTLQYYAGVPDYIEAHNITDPATGKYIGECGMGVSGKNPVLHDNPNQVIALDVWMYDKLDPRDNANSTRVLLSPYAVAHNLAQAFGDGSGAGTVEARKGAHFAVDGRNLCLDGELQDVEYDADGVFRTARVQLNVRPRQA